MTIYLATDHAGFELKEKVKEFLSAQKDTDGVEKYTVVDCGATVSDPADDYPLLISKAARAVSENVAHDPTGNKAIIFGTTGQGEAMVANRFPGVRAVVYYGGTVETCTKIITLSREHNDANVLSIGAQFVSVEEACSTIQLWLDTAFSGAERHVRRIAEIEEETKMRL